jgi:hypothetical protein
MQDSRGLDRQQTQTANSQALVHTKQVAHLNSHATERGARKNTIQPHS